jgi:hypothetical protein
MSEGKKYKFLRAFFVLAFSIFFLRAGTTAQARENYSKFSEPKVLAEFLIAKGGDPILLPVTFQREDYLFLFDTGSTHMVFDTSFRNDLGQLRGTAAVVTPQNKKVTVECYDAPEALLGPLNIKECGNVLCAEIEELDLIEDERISGIIGMNFLIRYAVQIDFDGGILTFLQPLLGENPNWGEAFASNHSSPLVLQTSGNILNNIKADFTIDTGCLATGTLDRSVFSKVVPEERAKTLEVRVKTLAGILDTREARIHQLSVGPFEYEGLIFEECSPNLLGLSFLSRHTVTFDFFNGIMYLEEGRQFRKKDERDMSGLRLVRYSNKTLIYAVEPDSPAYNAGIRAGDVITRVANRNALSYQLWELRALLKSKGGRTISMTVKRADEVKEVPLQLECKL